MLFGHRSQKKKKKKKIERCQVILIMLNVSGWQGVGEGEARGHGGHVGMRSLGL